MKNGFKDKKSVLDDLVDAGWDYKQADRIYDGFMATHDGMTVDPAVAHAWIRGQHLGDPNHPTGLLSPKAQFYGCAYHMHDKLIRILGFHDEHTAEDEGWVKITYADKQRSYRVIRCHKPLTYKQYLYCRKLGFHLDKTCLRMGCQEYADQKYQHES